MNFGYFHFVAEDLIEFSETFAQASPKDPQPSLAYGIKDQAGKTVTVPLEHPKFCYFPYIRYNLSLKFNYHLGILMHRAEPLSGKYRNLTPDEQGKIYIDKRTVNGKITVLGPEPDSWSIVENGNTIVVRVPPRHSHHIIIGQLYYGSVRSRSAPMLSFIRYSYTPMAIELGLYGKLPEDKGPKVMLRCNDGDIELEQNYLQQWSPILWRIRDQLLDARAKIVHFLYQNYVLAGTNFAEDTLKERFGIDLKKMDNDVIEEMIEFAQRYRCRGLPTKVWADYVLLQVKYGYMIDHGEKTPHTGQNNSNRR